MWNGCEHRLKFTTANTITAAAATIVFGG